MASYKDAVKWIADEDAVGDTPKSMTFEQAFDAVDNILTVALVADVWGLQPQRLAVDVVKARGFTMPRNFLAKRP